MNTGVGGARIGQWYTRSDKGAEPPEDWTGPVDDDDLGYSETHAIEAERLR